MNVLHLIAPSPVGGAESVVKALAAARLRASGPDSVAVATLLPGDAGDHPFVAGLRRAGIPVEPISAAQRRYWKQAAQVDAVIRRRGVAVLHTHIQQADFVGYLAARQASVPVVATVHGYTARRPKGMFYEWFDRRLLRRFAGVICVSDVVRDTLLRAGCRGERLHVIQNGYAGGALLDRDTARRRLGIAAGDRAVGWVGRLSVEKGPDLLLQAMAGVTIPDVVTVIVGDGPVRAAVEAQATAARLPVKILGRLEDAGTLLRGFDALAISSRTEGTPMILLEAMAAEVPVVSFAVGGVPQVVTERSAWLAPVGDATALGAAVTRALTNPEEAARRSREARRVLDERFALDRWVARVEDVYARVVSR